MRRTYLSRALGAALMERKSDPGDGGGSGGGTTPTEIKTMIEAQGRAWEEYKKTNDERLAKLAKGESVTELETKLGKMEAELTEISKKAKELQAAANRPKLEERSETDRAREVKRHNHAVFAHANRLSRGAPGEQSADDVAAYGKGFALYLRKGVNVDAMSEADRKAINVGSDPDGGYLASPEIDAAIDRVATKASSMRQVAQVTAIGSGSLKKLVKTSGASAGGWGGETTPPSETGTPGWAELEFVVGTLWAEPRMTSQALEDVAYDLEGDLSDEIGITFADQEGQAYIDGDGVNKPRGFLAYPIVANASYAWGKLGYIASGAAADFAASNPSDKLMDLQHALKRSYRANAVWYSNDGTIGKIRKFKDGQGNYLWAPSGLQNGMVGQLLGYQLNTDDYMPDVAADAYPLAFGDFRRGYRIVDRRGVVILRDPYTAKPYIKFYATRRVGGGVQNFEAIKLLKIAST